MQWYLYALDVILHRRRTRPGLKKLEAEYGTPKAESIRRAVKAYLIEKGALPTPKGGPKPKKRE